jgi:hypothetical protein
MLCATHSSDIFFVSASIRESLSSHILKKKKTPPWPESVSELYLLSDSSLSAKLMPTFADRGCHVISVTVLYSSILGFLDRSRYFFLRAAPQLYSRGWVDPVPDPLLHRESGGAGNRTRICSQEL